MTDRTVSVGLDANISGFLSKMAAAGLSTKGLGSALSDVNGKVLNGEASFKKLGSAFDGVVSGQMAVAAAGVIAAGALVKFAKDGVASYVELAGEVRKYESVTDASAEQSSRMVAESRALGVSTDSLSSGMFRLAHNVEANRAQLSAYGVEVVRNAKGNVDLTRTFESVAEAYQRTGNIDIVRSAFGRGATDLLPLLRADRQELEAIDAEARAHHEFITDADQRKAREYQIETRELHEAWTGLARGLGEELVPVLTKAEIALTGVIDDGAKAADAVGKVLSPFGRVAGAVGDLVLGHGKAERAAYNQAAAEQTLADKLSEDQQAAQGFLSELDALATKTFGVESAQDKFNKGLAEFGDSVRAAQINGDRYATSLDASTTAGLANREMLRGMVGDILDTAKAAADQGQDVDAATSVQRQALDGVLTQLGFNKAATQEYTDVLRDMNLALLQTMQISSGGGLGDSFVQAMAIGAQANKVIFGSTPTNDAFGNPIGSGGRGTSNAADLNGPKAEQALRDQARAQEQQAAYLKALHDEHLTALDNMFKQGALSVTEYVHALDGELAHETRYTAQWESLQERKQAALQQLADFYKGVADHQTELQDNEYAVGVLGKDQYLALLRERLKGLEQYSNEWKRVWDEIKQIEGDALDAQIKLIQAYDQGRQFQHAFDSLADQRALSASRGLMSAVPQTSSTSIVKTVSYSPTLNAYGADATRATTTANQQMRDYAALVGV